MQECLVQVQFKRGIAQDFVKVAHPQVVGPDVPHGRSRRRVDVQSRVLAKLADPKQVGSVRHDDDVVQMVLPGNRGEQRHLLTRVYGVRFSDDRIEGDRLGQQIVPAHTTLCLPGISIRSATQRHEDRSNLLTIQRHRMIQSGMIDRRRTAVVLRRTKHCDRIGGLCLILTCHQIDVPHNISRPSNRADYDHGQHKQPNITKPMAPLRMYDGRNGAGYHLQ